MHDWLFEDIRFVRSETWNMLAIYPLKFNEINIFLVNYNFIFLVSIYRYL